MTVARIFLASALALGFWGMPNPFALAGWGDFYTSTQKKSVTKPRVLAPVQSICIREILLAQTRYDIPQNILLAIGLQEAGTRISKQLVVWPWVVNAEGRGFFFDTKARAINWVQEQLDGGMESIDVGCMQVNLRWHPEAFASLTEAFTPEANVDYAARLLRSHYEVTGDWLSAAGRYHSKTPEKQQIYLASLERNMRVANKNIDKFTVMAGLGGTRIIPVTQQSQPTEQVARKPRSGNFWTADLSADGESQSRFRSLYSQAELQPILPNFQRVTSRGTP